MKTLFSALIALLFTASLVQGQWTNVSPKLLGGYSSDYGAAMTYKNGVTWAGYHTLFMSPDSGVTWAATSLDLGGGFMMDVQFFDERIGVVASWDNGVIVTTDQGKNWSNALGIGSCLSVCFGKTQKDIIAANRDGDGGNVFTSHDGGNTWTKHTLEVYYGSVYDLRYHKVNGNIIALSRSVTPERKSHFFISTDNGDTWTQKSGDVDLDCYSFAIHDCKENIAYIVNEDYNDNPNGLSEILVSSNYGASWTSKIQTNAPSLAGAVVTSRSAAFAPGSSNGGVLRSIDSGNTWKNIGGPLLKEDCRSIIAINDNIILGADRQGNIWRTINSGGSPLPFTPDPLDYKAVLSTEKIVNDTIGATIWMPIILKRSAQVPSFDMVLHYDSIQLVYLESVTSSGKVVDIAGTKWNGRSKLHFNAADLPPVSDTIGYSKFLFYPYEPLCASLHYDSLRFEEVNCSSGVALANDSAYGSIGSYPSCGRSAIAYFLRYGQFPEFALKPNPATETLSIIPSEDVGKVDIDITNALGEMRIRQKGTFTKDEAFTISLGDLAAGMYYIRISGMGMTRVIPFVHVK